MARAGLFLLLCAAVLAQPGGRGVISGTIIDATSGDPVRKAVVTATWQGTPRSWATTGTNGSGQFVFERLPPGKYDLRATKQGLGTAIYGANSVRELGDLITLGDGETRGDLKLRFIRSGTISGRVVDHDGDPLHGVQVELLRAGRNLGERILVNYRQADTDDRGEYKISSVDPGEYYVLCNPNAPRNNGANRQMMVQQYYGGGRDSKDARVLSVRGGEVLSGFDFTLTVEQPAKITGRVVGVPDLGQPDPVEPPVPGRVTSIRNGPLRMNQGMVSVTLSPQSNQPWTQGFGAAGPDYRFEIPEVVPGRYRLGATVRVKDKSYSASELIDAREGPNEVVLALSPAMEVKGHLKVEGPAVHPFESFQLALCAPGNGGGRPCHTSRVAKDGSFTIEQVPPGEWVLNINPSGPYNGPSPLAGLFDKSVQLGDKDFLLKRVEIPPGSDAPLKVVVSSNTATVEGEVDAAGADAKRAGILLEPFGKWHTMARFYYSAVADDSGKFKMIGIAPGRYKIFALEKIMTANYRNPESGDLLDAFGEELEVAEGATVETHPKLVPEEKAKEILKP